MLTCEVCDFRAYLFTLRMNFATVDDRDAWFKKFKKLAEYVAENEPTTLAYEAATSEEDPLEVLVYERSVHFGHFEAIAAGATLPVVAAYLAKVN